MRRLGVLTAGLIVLIAVVRLAFAVDDVFEGGYFIDEMAITPSTMTPVFTRTASRSVTPTFTPTPSPTPVHAGTQTPAPCVKVFNVPPVGQTTNADNRFSKHPLEGYPICCIFSRRMDHEDRVTDGMATVEALKPNCSVNGIIGSTSIQEQKVGVRVASGTDNCSYQITLVATTGTGNTLICPIRMDVESNP